MIGFTTSVPVEVIFAAKLKPVDLNNIFISNENPNKYLDIAEKIGFPRSTCSWIKGIYSVVRNNSEINKVINVIEGDCSNTRALMEILEYDGVECITFSYPANRDYGTLKQEINNLCKNLNVNIDDVNSIKKDLFEIRNKVKYFDELTWKFNKVTGFENHYWLVSTSDFFGDYKEFDSVLQNAIEKAEGRDSINNGIRLGYIGVPPIYGDIYDTIEFLGGRVVLNEVQRQFTMYDSNEEADIIRAYLNFTYPYDLKGRLSDIKKQIELRNISGIIHYTQAFCFRGIEDILIRKELDVPVLTIEGDRPGQLDARTKLRIEAFMDMLRD